MQTPRSDDGVDTLRHPHVHIVAFIVRGQAAVDACTTGEDRLSGIANSVIPGSCKRDAVRPQCSSSAASMFTRCETAVHHQ